MTGRGAIGGGNELILNAQKRYIAVFSNVTFKIIYVPLLPWRSLYYSTTVMGSLREILIAKDYNSYFLK